MKQSKLLYKEYKVGREHSIKSASYLLSKFGNPEKNLRFIHVAGTNGKGSTSAMITSILAKSDYKVGLFTSPHLIAHNERIRVNDSLISEEKLSSLFAIIEAEEKEMVEEGYRKLTIFSKYMIASFLYFKEEQVDFVVLEVGIGGRYDSTNVINNSLVSVITPIGFDHSEILGDTLGKIAFDKAGIIKEKGLVVNSNKNHEVNEVIDFVASRKSAKVFLTGKAAYYKVTLNGTYFNYDDKEYFTNLIGEYQVINAITSIKAIELLSKNFHIKAGAIYEGFKRVNFTGRMEVIGTSPTFIIDGAHNPHAAKSLKITLANLLNKRKAIAIVGFKEGKDYEKILDILSPHFKTIIVTKPLSEKAVSINNVVEKLSDYNGDIYSYDLIESSINKALEIASSDDIIIGFGSFYLIGAIKEIFLKK